MPLPLVFAAALQLSAPQEVLHREIIGRFECPEPADLGSPRRERLARDLARGLSAETPLEEMAGYARLFLDQGFTTDETVDQFVAAACPIIARDPAMNTYEKTGKIQAFAAQAFDVTSAQAPVADPNRW